MSSAAVELAPVTESPAHDEALRLVDSPATTSASPETSASNDAAAPRRRGGFPKGGRRDSSGRLVRDGGTPEPIGGRRRREQANDSSNEPSPNASRVYTAEVHDGPAPSATSNPPNGAMPASADPALIEFVKPRADLAIKALTMILARLTKKPAAVATEEERELLASAIALEVATKLPEFAARAGEASIGAAVLVYGTRLLELYMPNGFGGAAAPTPAQNPMAGHPAPPSPAPTPPPAIAAPRLVSDDEARGGYGTIPN